MIITLTRQFMHKLKKKEKRKTKHIYIYIANLTTEFHFMVRVRHIVDFTVRVTESINRWLINDLLD